MRRRGSTPVCQGPATPWGWIPLCFAGVSEFTGVALCAGWRITSLSVFEGPSTCVSVPDHLRRSVIPS